MVQKEKNEAQSVLRSPTGADGLSVGASVRLAHVAALGHPCQLDTLQPPSLLLYPPPLLLCDPPFACWDQGVLACCDDGFLTKGPLL